MVVVPSFLRLCRSHYARSMCHNDIYCYLKYSVSDAFRLVTQEQRNAPTRHRYFSSGDPSSSTNTIKRANRDGDPSSSAFENVKTPSVDKHEMEKFARMSNSWWDLEGPFKPLHQMNRARCEFIKECMDNFQCLKGDKAKSKLRVLDVGCGGGILSESLAKMDLNVVGIDLNAQGIETARQHAANDSRLANKIEYRTTSVEEICKEGKQFDIVIASEVIEHVASVPDFCTSLVQASSPGGIIILSTLNRTPSSYVAAIVGAEYVLKWVPEGTHEWEKFITPEELVHHMEAAGKSVGNTTCKVDMTAGMTYQPITGLWYLSKDLSINYISSFLKVKD
eukprot:jgi/Picsp_1/1419/NSC_04898-R1_dihydroxypolyprenylbenzoate methyltransferase